LIVRPFGQAVLEIGASALDYKVAYLADDARVSR
jgi:hypothetical protein